MGIAASIALFTYGAIITFALERVVWGIDLDALGIGTMVIGAIGGVVSIARWRLAESGNHSRGLAVVRNSDLP